MMCAVHGVRCCGARKQLAGVCSNWAAYCSKTSHCGTRCNKGDKSVLTLLPYDACHTSC
jgi:hypothetical protein